MKILIALVVLIAAFVGYGLTLPTEFAIAKSTVIEAEPAQVHAWVGDLEKWDAWAPWKEEDETMTVKFGDKTTGVGAYQFWSGKDGDGELTFTKCDAESGIAYDMAFILEEEKHPSKSAMTYKKVDGGTEVTWTMEGDAGSMLPPIVGGYIAKFAMVGSIESMFDRGLNNLKEKVEAK